MPWLYRERGPQWKQGWTSRTLASISAPPLPLLTIFAIVVLFLFLSQYTEYKSNMRSNMVNFQLFLFLLPILMVIILSISFSGGFVVRAPRAEHGSIHRTGSSPWGVALLVLVLLFLISYQSSFHSKWFRPLWSSH